MNKLGIFANVLKDIKLFLAFLQFTILTSCQLFSGLPIQHVPHGKGCKSNTSTVHVALSPKWRKGAFIWAIVILTYVYDDVVWFFQLHAA